MRGEGFVQLQKIDVVHLQVQTRTAAPSRWAIL
jgi:hypothetical protein